MAREGLECQKRGRKKKRGKTNKNKVREREEMKEQQKVCQGGSKREWGNVRCIWKGAGSGKNERECNCISWKRENEMGC